MGKSQLSQRMLKTILQRERFQKLLKMKEMNFGTPSKLPSTTKMKKSVMTCARLSSRQSSLSGNKKSMRHARRMTRLSSAEKLKIYRLIWKNLVPNQTITLKKRLLERTLMRDSKMNSTKLKLNSSLLHSMSQSKDFNAALKDLAKKISAVVRVFHLGILQDFHTKAYVLTPKEVVSSTGKITKVSSLLTHASKVP